MELNRWLPMILLIKLIELSRLLQSDLIVAKDGSSNFTTVNEAIASAPENNAKRFVIYVKKGIQRSYTYQEEEKRLNHHWRR
ncbi:unnamed protein product [Arabidopsis lyrata]|uniref:Pectinesterase catalytic domain-containing protein n=1 Tax=Arabidopsis lyrata subsp. lyrata TaxID=81972 RepID=D7KMD9_ARALL|nr:hypothetical protein ARALYDRAFT_888440 [Arabidopsis lyrata subsp. lyrata]CAH8251931.1 unnamed protein product [Arabidopsis lyrata]